MDSIGNHCPQSLSEWLAVLILEQQVSLCGKSRETADEGVQNVLTVREDELHRFPHSDVLVQRDG